MTNVLFRSMECLAFNLSNFKLYKMEQNDIANKSAIILQQILSFRLSFLSYLVILTVLDSKRTTCIFQEKRYAAKYHSHFLNFYRRMVHIVMYN